MGNLLILFSKKKLIGLPIVKQACQLAYNSFAAAL